MSLFSSGHLFHVKTLPIYKLTFYFSTKLVNTIEQIYDVCVIREKFPCVIRRLCDIIIAMRIRKEIDTLEKEEVNLIASASDALAHPARVEIFRFIYKKNMNRESVCNKDLVANFDYSQATVSQHMKKLLISGIVTAEKKGTYSYYFVNLGMLGKYLDAVKKLNS